MGKWANAGLISIIKLSTNDEKSKPACILRPIPLTLLRMLDHSKILISNIMLNGLSNVRILQEAAWDKKETIKLYIPRYFFGLSSARKANESTEVSVHAIPLDMILTGLRRQIDLVKIDAEGAELYILKVLEKTLKNTKNIILEASDNIQEITSLLKVKGFRIKKLKFTSYIYAYREDVIAS